MKSIEVQLNEALAQITVKDAEILSLKEAVTNGKVATAAADRASQLKESKLPEPCSKRINEAFAKSTDNAGLKEAINAEADYVKSLRTITKHNGVEDNGTLQESTDKLEGYKKEQFESAIRSGMSEAEAQGFSGYTPKK